MASGKIVWGKRIIFLHSFRIPLWSFNSVERSSGRRCSKKYSNFYGDYFVQYSFRKLSEAQSYLRIKRCSCSSIPDPATRRWVKVIFLVSNNDSKNYHSGRRKFRQRAKSSGVIFFFECLWERFCFAWLLFAGGWLHLFAVFMLENVVLGIIYSRISKMQLLQWNQIKSEQDCKFCFCNSPRNCWKRYITQIFRISWINCSIPWIWENESYISVTCK